MPDAIITILYFFAALFPLVLVHELGHFIVAKMNHVRVDEFGIGFPPRLVRLFTAGGTEYTINALPLGGFVRLAGEDDPDMPGAFAAASKGARAAVLFAGPLANFMLAAVVWAGIAMVVGAPSPVVEDSAVSIVQVVADSRAEAAGIETGDIVLSIDQRPLKELADESGYGTGGSTAPGMQVLIDATKAAGDQAIDIGLLRGVERAMVLTAPAGLSLGPAELLGLPAMRVDDGDAADDAPRPGDLIIAPDGVARGLEQPELGQTLVVLRGEELETLTIAVTPEDRQIGVSIGPLSMLERLGVVEAQVYGARRTGDIMQAMVGLLGAMIVGRQEADIAGPVGIARMGREVGERGLTDFMAFMAILSINLGIINLVPIPGLDGGRLIFIAVEALRGRRVEPSREAIVHFIGILLVVGLMLVITAYEVRCALPWDFASCS